MQNNILFEMLPLIAFFVTYYISKNLFLATGVCIAASWLQLLFCYFKFKHVNKNTWISTILITILGGLTIILHNKTFVMLKPTVLFWILGISMLIGQLANKNGIKIMLSREIQLPDSVWQKLNIAWAIFFIVLGILNLYIAFHFSEWLWVKFKVFGTLILTIIFTIVTVIYIFIEQKKSHHTKSSKYD